MKKIFFILLSVLLLMMACVPALGQGVVVLESPDTPKADNSGSLDDLKIDVGVDLGDRIYTPKKIVIQDEISHLGGDWRSGTENQYVCLWIEAFNFSTKPVNFFKDATVVVTYESERGTYKFGGFVRQCEGEGSYRIPYENTFDEIGQLLKRNYLFGCKVPNFVVENPGEILMEITDGKETLKCIIRE